MVKTEKNHLGSSISLGDVKSAYAPFSDKFFCNYAFEYIAFWRIKLLTGITFDVIKQRFTLERVNA